MARMVDSSIVEETRDSVHYSTFVDKTPHIHSLSHSNHVSWALQNEHITISKSGDLYFSYREQMKRCSILLVALGFFYLT